MQVNIKYDPDPDLTMKIKKEMDFQQKLFIRINVCQLHIKYQKLLL